MRGMRGCGSAHLWLIFFFKSTFSAHIPISTPISGSIVEIFSFHILFIPSFKALISTITAVNCFSTTSSDAVVSADWASEGGGGAGE
jgi:hypothetical protein